MDRQIDRWMDAWMDVTEPSPLENGHPCSDHVGCAEFAGREQGLPHWLPTLHQLYVGFSLRSFFADMSEIDVESQKKVFLSLAQSPGWFCRAFHPTLRLLGDMYFNGVYM